LHRIGLLVDDVHVPKYVRELIDWAHTQAEFEISALIVHKAEQSSVRGLAKVWFLIRSQGFYTALSRILFAVLSRVEHKLFLRSAHHADHHRAFFVGDRVGRHLNLTPRVSKSGFVYRFSEEQIAEVRALGLDLLIRCGNGIIKGGILSASRHGVLSMHHGDNRVNRGGPAAFWEVFERHPSTGFIVQRLTEELDGGDVLFRGSVPTDFVYMRNHAELMERSTAYLIKTIVDVCKGRARAEAPFVYDNRLYRTPLAHDTIRYALRTAMLVAGKAVRRLLGYRWRWGVAYVSGDWNNAVLWRGKRLVNPPGRFLADPFVLMGGDGRHFLLVEDFGFREDKGVISAYEVHADGSNSRLGVVLEEPFHLSFPFLFRHGGQLYMVPETSAAGQIRLYRCTGEPMEWAFEKVLMDGVSATDTMIFEKDGKWWMLTTIAPKGSLHNASELCIFFADDPLSGDWTPHPLNPVMMDASRGRNGGLLRKDGALYRVAQQRGFGRYGTGMTICRIDRLDEEDYSETPIQEVRPLFFAGIEGTHHLHQDGNLVAYDYVHNSRTRRAGR
jgi:hypothetical protein